MTEAGRTSARGCLLAAIVAAAIAALALLDSIPQDPAYHDFADTRTHLAIPNFWNVVSNVPFILVGAAGLRFLRKQDREGILAELRPAYIILFCGVLLTGAGSGWYHLAPNNRTLIWDRLPMTIAFMSLFTIIIGEHISQRWARKLLFPLLVAGTLSVAYWALSERRGAGDLRPYALVQFLPMLLIPLMLLMYRSRFDRTAFIWWVIAAYAVSKVLEYYDGTIFALRGIISGHSLKHVVAALGPVLLLYGFATRHPAGDRAGHG